MTTQRPNFDENSWKRNWRELQRYRKHPDKINFDSRVKIAKAKEKVFGKPNEWGYSGRLKIIR